MQPVDGRPNLLFVFTDQQSALALGGAGNPWLRTPALDGLAARGVRFDRSYCAAPVCGPARACLVTGRTPQETGVRWNGQSLALGLTTVGERLREAGYETAWSGKWHLPKSYPLGVDDLPGYENLVLPPDHPNLQRDIGYGWPGYALGENTDGPFVDEAIRFLDRPRRKPFFLTVSLHNPHDICWWVRRPTAPPDDRLLPPLPANFGRDATEPGFVSLCRERDHYGEELRWTEGWSERDWRRYLYAYYRMTESVDAQVGRLLDALRSRGLDQNTLVIFTSDHGEGMAAHQWLVKLSFIEEVVRVPLIVAGPGVTQPGRVDAASLISGLDIVPTLCDLGGAHAPDVRGRSLRPLLEGALPWHDRPVFTAMSPDDHRPDLDGRMVVTRDYKYCAYSVGPHAETLHHLASDPGERADVADHPEHRAALEEHRALLGAWMVETADPFQAGSPTLADSTSARAP